MMKKWRPLISEPGLTFSAAYSVDSEGYWLANARIDEETGKCLVLDSQIVLSGEELAKLPPVRELIDRLSSPYKGIDWLHLVCSLVRLYTNEHDWANDDDPASTQGMLDAIGSGLPKIYEALCLLAWKVV